MFSVGTTLDSAQYSNQTGHGQVTSCKLTSCMHARCHTTVRGVSHTFQQLLCYMLHHITHVHALDHTLRENCLHTYLHFPFCRGNVGLPPPGGWRGPLAVKQGRTFNNMVHSPLALFNTHAYTGNTCSHKPTQYWRWPVEGVGSLLEFFFSLTPPP